MSTFTKEENQAIQTYLDQLTVQLHYLKKFCQTKIEPSSLFDSATFPGSPYELNWIFVAIHSAETAIANLKDKFVSNNSA